MMSLPLNIGQILPDYTVTNSERQSALLSEEMGTRGILIFVLRGTWCPWCVHQIMAARTRYPKYLKRGVKAVFVIPEEESKVGTFALTASRPLPFGLHADESAEIANLLVGAPEEGTSRQVGLYLLNAEREVVWGFAGWDDEFPINSDVLEVIDTKLPSVVDQTA